MMMTRRQLDNLPHRSCMDQQKRVKKCVAIAKAMASRGRHVVGGLASLVSNWFVFEISGRGSVQAA